MGRKKLKDMLLVHKDDTETIKELNELIPDFNKSATAIIKDGEEIATINTDINTVKEILEEGKNNMNNFLIPKLIKNETPKVIIENINPELEAKYATNGSMAIDLITREEVEIPCNNYFKQSENILHFLFHKIKDIYEGNMKAEKDWHIIDKEIKALNTQYNKYHQTMIPMNIKVKYPEGYGALLIPRGSTFKKYGLLQSNSIGLIDTDFCSEHWLPVINLTNKNVTIPKGVRIAQLVFIKKENLEIVNGIVEQHDLHNGNGSTGI